MIPVIDLFAGPGGLGEGFSSLIVNNVRQFDIKLSIEKDKYAHKTLLLRSFFRKFNKSEVPEEYYDLLRLKDNKSREDELIRLLKKYPEQANKALEEAWHAELGNEKYPPELVDERIIKAIGDRDQWVLIGGPPCQAYSVVGRSRRQEKILDEKKDKRIGLYKQYLRILAVHNPAVFVMENVKGMLSAKTEQNSIFSKILSDLTDPVSAYLCEYKTTNVKLNCPGYRIYSLVSEPAAFDLHGNPIYQNQDFVIKSENYGVPQTRHRVILLGIRVDIDNKPTVLESEQKVPLFSVISGLPEIRSYLSESEDSGENWKKAINKILKKVLSTRVDGDVKDEIKKQLDKMNMIEKESGGDYLTYDIISVLYRPEWFLDKKIEGVCNHASRGHMDSDLLRYFFAACFALVKKRSPLLKDFPSGLLPEHKNVIDGIKNKKFADRFRVQLWDEPCKTITSHISKDGHYYIHPDPTQCRCLTVREAARIQTFPDNYYFFGPRTSQFIQVGNAVPPLLANKIAGIVLNILKSVS